MDMLRTGWVATLVCAAVFPASAQQTRREQDDAGRVDTTYAFDARGTVTLTLGQGAIVVRGWNRTDIRVRAQSERSVLRMEASATRLSLEATRGRSGDTHFEVMVPVGVHVRARATQGDVSVAGTRGGVDASTQSGDIVVEDVTEMVDLATLSGAISARGITGRLDVRSSGGDVMLVDVKGDVEATSVGGDLVMRNVVARNARGKTTGGDVTFEGAIDPTGRYEFGSHSGDVDLIIPAGTGAQVTVATYNGSIESDFPITLKPGEHGVGATKRFTFDIGKGDARISAESFSGDVTVRSIGRRPQD